MHISRKRSHEDNIGVQHAKLSSKIRKLLSWVPNPDIRRDLFFIRDNVLAHANCLPAIENVKKLLEPVERKIQSLGLTRPDEPLKENIFSDST